jgi:hypothetical protein
VHSDEDELSYVVAGTIWARVGGVRPKPCPAPTCGSHAESCTASGTPGPEPARVLEVISPAAAEPIGPTIYSSTRRDRSCLELPPAKHSDSVEADPAGTRYRGAVDVKRAADLCAQGLTLRQIGAELGLMATAVGLSTPLCGRHLARMVTSKKTPRRRLRA